MSSAPPTRDHVWRALAEIPDPEIPVISIVDLGVVADVRVEGRRVEVDFTPTFMGCPALDTMRAQMEDAIRALDAEPDVRVVLDDSWSTDRITAEGRARLREAGFAPPTPRSAEGADAAPAGAWPLPLPLVRLDRHAPRQPLRPDAVPVAPLLQRVPPAVRAVQDDLMATSAFLLREPAASARGLRRVLREPAARGGAPARGRPRRRRAVRGVRAALRRRAARARSARERASAHPPHARPLRRADRRGRVPPGVARAPRARRRARAPLGLGRPRRSRGPVHDARLRGGRCGVPALDDVRLRARAPRRGGARSRGGVDAAARVDDVRPASFVLTATRQARSAGWR